MSKQITTKIECCIQCPYCLNTSDLDEDNDPFGSVCELTNNSIEDDSVVANDCPLEDYKEEAKIGA